MDSLTNSNTECFAILVGVAPPSTTDPIPRNYLVPKALLSKIPYFQAIMKEHWIEGMKNTVLFAHEEPAVILEFVMYLTHGHFNARNVKCELGWALTSHDGPIDSLFAFRCYAFGEMIGCTSFRNHAMTAIHGYIHNVTKNIITYTLGNCHPDSSLYVWLVHYIVANFGDEDRLNLTSGDFAEAISGHITAMGRLFRGLKLPEYLRKKAIQERDYYKAWECTGSDLDPHLERLHERFRQERDDSMDDDEDEDEDEMA